MISPPHSVHHFLLFKDRTHYPPPLVMDNLPLPQPHVLLFAIKWGHLLFDLSQTSMLWLRSIHFLGFFISIISLASWLPYKGQFMWKAVFISSRKVLCIWRCVKTWRLLLEKKKGKVIQLMKDVEIATIYTARTEKIWCNFFARDWSIHLYLCQLIPFITSSSCCLGSSVAILTSISRLISDLKFSFFWT